MEPITTPPNIMKAYHRQKRNLMRCKEPFQTKKTRKLEYPIEKVENYALQKMWQGPQ